MHRKSWTLVALPIAAGLLTSCAGTSSDAYVIENDPGSVEHVDGSEIGRVTLTDGAEGRLGVKTAPVGKAGSLLSVPDEAIFVDPDGAWWVYTNPEPGVYVRQEVTLDLQRNGRALLSSGPGVGARVVTVGVAELYGIEAEVGH